MVRIVGSPARQLNVPWCDRCILRSNGGFKDFAPDELAFMVDFKLRHGRAWAGDTIFDPTGPAPLCCTIFSGWAAQYRLSPDGKRQVINVLFPGDTIGLEAALGGVALHAVQAVTDVTFCVLDGARLRDLVNTGGLGLRLLHLLAHQNLQLSRHLSIMNAGTGRANLASFIYETYSRLAQRRLIQGLTFQLPLSSSQLAEVLGMTPVHLQRVKRALREERLVLLENKTVQILDLDRLARAALLSSTSLDKTPLL
jgi:CRP/FNR family transcriptional regulator, anaerobic regulatory protein